jgi:hypothetical protein
VITKTKRKREKEKKRKREKISKYFLLESGRSRSGGGEGVLHTFANGLVVFVFFDSGTRRLNKVSSFFTCDS